jgi:hypothetical protein
VPFARIGVGVGVGVGLRGEAGEAAVTLWNPMGGARVR